MSAENEIVLWDNSPRQGVLRIEPLSNEARELVDAPLLAYIKEFPSFRYGTSWGDWDKSNSSWIASKIKTFAGGGDQIPAQIVQMLGGSEYKPPVLTDKWTQLTAELGDAYLDFEFTLIAYPVIPDGVDGAHVEGLRYDGDNMMEVLTFHGNKMSNYWNWLDLGKKCMMPRKEFSSRILKDNIDGIRTNLAGDNGKKILNGIGNLAHGADGLFKSDVTMSQSLQRGVRGLNDIVDGVMGVGSRLGSTFLFQVWDDDGKILWNSKAPALPLDFYIEDLSFKFSPHILSIVNSKGKRVGSCPEYCEIKIKMTSVTKASPEQIQAMHTKGD